jgi:hypothetical protein
MDTYTITKDSIKSDGTLEVTFSIDGKKQKLSGCPVEDEEALKAYLIKYGEAYARGLALVAPVEIKAEVKAMEAKALPLTKAVVVEEAVIVN